MIEGSRRRPAIGATGRPFFENALAEEQFG